MILAFLQNIELKFGNFERNIKNLQKWDLLVSS